MRHRHGDVGTGNQEYSSDRAGKGVGMSNAVGEPGDQSEPGEPGEPGGERPFTLAIDIGGTGLKASVLDASGAMVADRVKKTTAYPMPPVGDSGMVTTLEKMVRPLPQADRISAGFPGMVRSGLVLSAPHFVTTKGPGSSIDDDLVKAWDHFDLAQALARAIGKPARVANDADVQGLAVVEGKGLELVITLGTGFGTALFLDGQLLPHLEIAHQPFRKGDTYNEQLGERARKDVGDHRWRHRAVKAFRTLDALFFFDHLYVGGGNATRIKKSDLGDLEKRTTMVDNAAGILGGIRLWEGHHLGV